MVVSTCWYWYFLWRYVLISSGELSSLLTMVSSCCISTGSFPNRNIRIHLSASAPKACLAIVLRSFRKSLNVWVAGSYFASFQRYLATSLRSSFANSLRKLDNISVSVVVVLTEIVCQNSMASSRSRLWKKWIFFLCQLVRDRAEVIHQQVLELVVLVFLSFEVRHVSLQEFTC